MYGVKDISLGNLTFIGNLAASQGGGIDTV